LEKEVFMKAKKETGLSCKISQAPLFTVIVVTPQLVSWYHIQRPAFLHCTISSSPAAFMQYA